MKQKGSGTNLSDVLRDVRSKLAFLSRLAPHPGLADAISTTAKDTPATPNARLRDTILASIRDIMGPSISLANLHVLEVAMAAQQERAVARLVALRYWTRLLYLREPLSLELLCKPAANAFSPRLAKGATGAQKTHILDNVRCGGARVTKMIFKAYYEDVLKQLFTVERNAQQLRPKETPKSQRLIRKGSMARLAELVVQMQLAEARRVGYGVRSMLVDLCTQHYSMVPSDLGGLLRAGVIQFVGQALDETLLSFAGKNPQMQAMVAQYSTATADVNKTIMSNAITLRRRPLHNRYEVWCLCRLLTMLSARHSDSSPKDATELHRRGQSDAKILSESVIRILLQHLMVLNRFRSYRALDENDDDDIEPLEADDGDSKTGDAKDSKGQEADKVQAKLANDAALDRFWQPDILDPENVHKKGNFNVIFVQK